MQTLRRFANQGTGDPRSSGGSIDTVIVPIGPQVVPFYGLYLDSYKVI